MFRIPVTQIRYLVNFKFYIFLHINIRSGHSLNSSKASLKRSCVPKTDENFPYITKYWVLCKMNTITVVLLLCMFVLKCHSFA